jgi:HK97 gp10 family phage protein
MREVIRIDGMEQLEAQFKKLERTVAAKIMRRALREGAKPIAAQVAENAKISHDDIPDTGALAESITVRAGKRRKGRVSFVVQTRAGDFKGHTFYGGFLEYGWKTGKRRDAFARRQKRIAGELRRQSRAARAFGDGRGLGKKGTEWRARQEAWFMDEGYRRAMRSPEQVRTEYRYPFIRPAFDATKDEAAEIIGNELAAGIKAEMSKPK